MPNVRCSYEGCTYIAENENAQIVAALLTTHALIHSKNDGLKKPDRPDFGIDMNEAEWNEVKFLWTRYKLDTGIEAKVDKKRSELLASCSKVVRSRLYQAKGEELATISEDDLLEAIKSAAVNKITINMHRAQFGEIVQEPGENPQSHLTRIRSKASLCNFQIKAKCSAACTKNTDITHSYAEDVIEAQLIMGLHNPDHRQKLLVEGDNYPTLVDKMNVLDTLFTHEQSQSQPSQAARTDGRNASQYKTDKGKKHCSCGKVVESKNEKHTSCNECFQKLKTKDCSCGAKILPSRKKCVQCAIKAKANTMEGDENEESTHFGLKTSWEIDDIVEGKFDAAEMKTQRSWMRKKAKAANDRAGAAGRSWAKRATTNPGPKFPHSVWNGTTFVPSAPKKQPMLNVRVAPMKNAMETWRRQVGLSNKKNQLGEFQSVVSAFSANYPANDSQLADSGAQTCSISEKTCLKMAIGPDEYLPTKMTITGATGNKLDVKGCVLLKIWTKTGETRQVVYVVESEAGNVLSCEALIALGILPPSFPNPMPDENNNSQSNRIDVECTCPERTEVPPLPEKIPYEATPENRVLLENYLKDYYKTSALNVCEHKAMPAVQGGPMTIHWKKDAKPTAVWTPAHVPINWEKEVNGLLEKNVNLGVIRKVPEGVPTKWCSRMIVAKKKTGKLRQCVDLRKVNDATDRELHHQRTAYKLVCDLPPNMMKTTLDCWNSYHALELDEEASNATTFITEQGTYQYLRAPQGLWSSGDAYTRRTDDIVREVEDKRKCVDDTLLFKPSMEELFWHTAKYIDKCGRAGIIFNPDKFKFGHEELEFAGFHLTKDGFKPTQTTLQSIKNFPIPKTITDVRSYFGLVEQVTYAFSKSEIMFPLRELLRKNRKFYWDDKLTEAFYKSRDHIVEQVNEGVKSFDRNRMTAITTDFSKIGLGFFMQQKYCSCTVNDPRCGPGHWKLVTAGSRFCKDAETRYSPVEGEALAMAYALNSAKMYTMGNVNLLVAVDHRPLLQIMGPRPLEEIINPRLQGLKQKVLKFQFEMIHIPGKKNNAADVASRHPGGGGPEFDWEDDDCSDTVAALASLSAEEHADDADDLEDKARATVSSMLSDFDILNFEDLSKACKLDEDATTIVRAVRQGFPDDKSAANDALKSVYHFKDELYELDGVPMVRGRMYVPASIRPQLLETLHSGHQGISGAPSNRSEELVEEPSPTMPFEQVCMDFFSVGASDYLVEGDRYSGWLNVTKMGKKTFNELEKVVLQYMSYHGVPDVIETDGGPPFNSHEWAQFCKKWRIRHRLSSAGYAQSNGRAEAAVKTAKKALLQHRNTNIRGLNESPAQIVYGTEVRDTLPRAPLKAWQKLNDDREMSRSKIRHDRGEAYNIQKTNLEPLKEGDTVSIQNCTGPKPLRFDRSGIVIQEIGNRQYQVESSLTRSPRYDTPRPTTSPRMEIPRMPPTPSTFTPPSSPTGANVPQEPMSTPSRTPTRERRKVVYDTPVLSPPQNESSRLPTCPATVTPSRSQTEGATPAPSATNSPPPPPASSPVQSRPKRSKKIPSKFKDMVPTSQLDI